MTTVLARKSRVRLAVLYIAVHTRRRETSQLFDERYIYLWWPRVSRVI